MATNKLHKSEDSFIESLKSYVKIYNAVAKDENNIPMNLRSLETGINTAIRKFAKRDSLFDSEIARIAGQVTAIKTVGFRYAIDGGNMNILKSFLSFADKISKKVEKKLCDGDVEKFKNMLQFGKENYWLADGRKLKMN